MDRSITKSARCAQCRRARLCLVQSSPPRGRKEVHGHGLTTPPGAAKKSTGTGSLSPILYLLRSNESQITVTRESDLIGLMLDLVRHRPGNRRSELCSRWSSEPREHCVAQPCRAGSGIVLEEETTLTANSLRRPTVQGWFWYCARRGKRRSKQSPFMSCSRLREGLVAVGIGCTV